MNLNRVKDLIKNHIGIKHKFRYIGARNQIDEFDGVITKCFPSIFIIETDNQVIKSFTYNDFIIKNIKIIS